MKTLLRSLLAAAAGFCLLASPARAQTFPNSTLDNWAIRNNVDAPTNWLTTDDIVAAILGTRIPTNTVVKAPTAHGGTFAAQLQTQSLLGQTVPGEIVLGSSFTGGIGGLELPGGLPFTARPHNIEFYYQLSGARAVADSAAMYVQLTRRVNGAATVVAQAVYYPPAVVTAYTLASVPLRYFSTLAPDSVAMVFSSGTANNVTAGTVFRVDDIIFTGTATAVRDAALNAALTVAPNPSPDGRYLLSSTEPSLLTAPLTVLDATGRVVRREAAPAVAAARSLDLSDLPSGIYTVQLFVPGGLVTRKLSR